ncbi:MAG: hypothetical protein HY352_00790 [Candidatus Omnitrophica bacterium]|nr:hypothetical protein [Candidatus Omnitrophota bacterium]
MLSLFLLRRGPRARPHERGAVLLFTVYMIALALLLLSGVFLQRTNIEMLSVRQMQNMQQAFHLAEGALDWALADVAQNPSRPDVTDEPVSGFAQDAASYTLTTDSDPTLRTVKANGTFGTLKQQVTATFKIGGASYPQEGFWANQIRLGRYDQNTSTFLNNSPLLKVVGTIRAAYGIPGAVSLYHILVDGTDSKVSAGPSQPLTVDDSTYPGYTNLFLPGFPYDEQTGIRTWPGVVPQLTQDPQAYPLTLPQRIDPRNDPLVDPSVPSNQCQSSGDLFLKNSQRHTVNNGDTGDTPDLDPAPGRILVCFHTLVLDGRSKLIFTAPATIYLTGYVDPLNDPRYDHLLDRFEFAGFGTGNSVAFAQNQKTTLQAVDGPGANAPVYNNGVEIVVPEWADRNPWGRTDLMFVGGTFHGSVAAPEAGVVAWGGENFNPIRIVADDIYYAGSAVAEPSITRSSDLVLTQHEGDGTPNPQLSGGGNRPTILSWTNTSSSSSP